MASTESSALISPSASVNSLGLPVPTAVTNGHSLSSIAPLNVPSEFSWRSSDVNLAWARSLAGSGHSTVSDMAIDSANNLYITGEFSGTVDFDSSANIFNLTSAGSTDAFIAKLDAEGGLLWATQLGGLGSDSALEIAIDSTGNLFTLGSFTGVVDFDPGVEIFQLTGAEASSMFVSKLNENGGFAWARSIEGNTTIASSLAIDSTDNVYIAGSFSGSVTFPSGADSFNLTSTGLSDAFIAKLNANGTFTWTKQIGGSGNDTASDLAIDQLDNLYITGTSDIDSSDVYGADVYGASTPLVAVVSRAFVAKLDGNGTFLWSETLPESGNSRSTNIAVDSTGSIYISGGSQREIDFNSNPDISHPASGSEAPSSDPFITKLSTDGSLAWTKSWDGSSGFQIVDITLDSADNLYTIGSFKGTIGFDLGPAISNLTSSNLTSSDGSSLFVARFDANSSADSGFTWVKTIAGSSASEINPTDIAIDTAGNVYMSGSFGGTVDFDPGSGSVNLTSGDHPLSALSYNGFLTKLSPQQSTGTGTLVSTILGSAAVNPTTGTPRRIAITFADSTNGNWEYSPNGGMSWHHIGTPSNSVPISLAANSHTRIRFVPGPGYEGVADIRYRVTETQPILRPDPIRIGQPRLISRPAPISVS